MARRSMCLKVLYVSGMSLNRLRSNKAESDDADEGYMHGGRRSDVGWLRFFPRIGRQAASERCGYRRFEQEVGITPGREVRPVTDGGECAKAQAASASSRAQTVAVCFGRQGNGGRVRCRLGTARRANRAQNGRF